METSALTQRLNSVGLKATPQRMAIYNALEEYGHASADLVFDKVKKVFPTISVATVYNALNGMAEAGIISRLILRDNCQYFDITVTAHNHFVCEECHGIWDVLTYLCPYPQAIYKLAGKVNKINVVFYGICKQCWEQIKQKEVGDGKPNSNVR